MNESDYSYSMLMNRLTSVFGKGSDLAKAFHLSFFFVPASPLLLGKVGRLLFFLVGIGFLSITLTACGGGGSGGSGSDGGPGNGDGGPGGNGGSGSLMPLGVKLTFAPIRGGFRIGNQSDFGDMVSLNIAATRENGQVVEQRNINIGEFVNGYDFTGLNDQSNYTFRIVGNLGDGRQQEVDIVFVWDENEEDYKSGGIRPGLDTDGDRRANSVDDDDDDDGLDDTNEREAQSNLGGVSCSLLADCDGDTITDINEEAAICVIRADCDRDGVRDVDEVAAECVTNDDCDNDQVRDNAEAAGCVENPDCDGDTLIDGADIDDDGDGLIEIATHEELNAVRYVLNGSGRKSSADGALDSTGCGGNGGITECSGYELVADISLATYANNEGGKGWQPLAHDTDNSNDGCLGEEAFDGTFEGNGWTISDLNINRPAEDCVGLFGQMAKNAEIRNLRLHAERVIGRGDVGGLIGRGLSVRIYSSSVVAGEVRGSDNVGGLVGDQVSQARIYSSSIVAGEVSGGNNVGGLVGYGLSAEIHSSSVVVGEVSGNEDVGGLVGQGIQAQIVSSSVVVGEVSGANEEGGLTGGFLGGKVAYSYVVSGSNTAILAGQGSGTGVASYWDSDTSDVPQADGNHGEAKTSNDLRRPTGYDGIYATWDDNTDLFGDGNVPLAVWCDRDNSGDIEGGEETSDNLIWDFGTSSQYPAIRCTPIDPAEWRSWWSLEGTPAKPQLNQTRLDALLN